jgi:hypothetical protein
LTFGDLIVLSIGFAAAMCVGALMLASSVVTEPLRERDLAQAPGIGDETADANWSVPAAQTGATATPKPTRLEGTATTTVTESPPAASGDARVVPPRPPGDGWSDGAAPLHVDTTAPSPTPETPPESLPPVELVVEVPSVPPVSALDDGRPASDPGPVPAGLARQGLVTTDLGPADEGWGSAINEARHTDGRGQDDARASQHRDGG